MRRLPGLLVGLVGFGLGIALMAQSGLGLGPWEVLNQGVGLRLGIPMGSASILLGIPILLCWIPLREWPGPGTLINIVLIGLSTNLGLHALPEPAARRVGVASGSDGGRHPRHRRGQRPLPRRRPWPRAARRPDDRRSTIASAGASPGRGWSSRSRSWRSAGCSAGRSASGRSPSPSASGPSCRSRWASSTAMAG